MPLVTLAQAADGAAFDALRLAVDPAQGVGLLLSLIRVAAFTVASPVLGRAWPATGRLTFVLAVGVFLTRPVPDVADLGPLIVAGVTNAAVGVSLGFLTGLLIHLFSVAGSLIDFSGGLAVAQAFDPSSGMLAAVYGTLFARTAVALFAVLGGLQVIVRGLAGSVRLIPLDGTVTLGPELAASAVRTAGEVMFAGVELALPVLSSLLVAEIVLALATRFAPQANVLMLGLPVKILIAMAMVGVVVATMPAAAGDLVEEVRRSTVDVLRSLRP